jgi:hypothetical protein
MIANIEQFDAARFADGMGLVSLARSAGNELIQVGW